MAIGVDDVIVIDNLLSGELCDPRRMPARSSQVKQQRQQEYIPSDVLTNKKDFPVRSIKKGHRLEKESSKNADRAQTAPSIPILNVPIFGRKGKVVERDAISNSIKVHDIMKLNDTLTLY